MSSSFADDTDTKTWTDMPFGGLIEDEQWLDRADHPLLNDVILKRVFEHVRRYDLKACRGVSKKWNEHTIPHMRSTFHVTIHGKKSTEENTETRRIVDFVKLFKANEKGIPFDKYRLGPFRTTDGAGKQFLTICGDSIKEIDLFQPYDVEYVRSIENVSELLKFSPKLEVLTLSGQFVSRSRNDVKLFSDSKPELSKLKKLTIYHETRKCPIKHCPTFFNELLSTAVNISDIGLDDTDYDGKPKSVISPMLKSIEKLGKESSIQSLSLKTINFEHIKILKRMSERSNGLKLKEIEISFKSDDDDDNVTTTERNKILSAQVQLATMFKDTLEGFHVIDGSRGIHVMEFPNMPKLKSFTFKFGVKKNFYHKHVNLNQILPVIKTLNISFDEFYPYGSGESENSDDDDEEFQNSERSEIFSQFQVCPTIHTLILDENLTTVPAFRNILRVFTNLRKLTLRPVGFEAEQIVRHIWTELTQLESLDLNAAIECGKGSRDIQELRLESLVTGVPMEALKEIRQVIPELEKMSVEKRREKILDLVEQHGTQPSIRNLTNLRHLSFNVTGPGAVYLSDLTGYLGIYLMKHLDHFDITRCRFTKTCCVILRTETGVETWSFKTGGFFPQDIIIPPFQFQMS